MVEPIAGVLGAAGVTLAAPALPYALAFAAGAMIYVVIDDIIPEAHQRYVPYNPLARKNLKRDSYLRFFTMLEITVA